MNELEEQLISFLIKYGEPMNVLIYNDVLTFVLKNPTFETNISLIVKFQEELMKEFPEFIVLKKLVTDKDHYWIVLIKDKN